MHTSMATYGIKQPQQAIHLLQNNTREVSEDFAYFLSIYDVNFINFAKIQQQSMSPGSVTGMSPSYSEPSPDYSMLLNQNQQHHQRLPTPSSNSPPLNSSQTIATHIGELNLLNSLEQFALQD